MRLIFTDAGHEVIEAATVEEARQAMARAHVDVALIDAGMDGSGVDLWRDIQTEASQAGRALLLTGDLPALGSLRGHPDVLSKPFDYDALLRRIQTPQS